MLVKSSSTRYASIRTEAKISSRLDALEIKVVREDEENSYKALEKLTKRSKQLASMKSEKDRDDVAKVGCLIRAVAGTEWGLNS